ncbi:MAG TPA: prolyl oligopeptidase family serine peptidase [Vicinamibacterales bacterium]|nr:prolyl oligopeptidase family serine peptidase [Vicinamibacterales bacterium]
MSSRPVYPPARIADVVDRLHGVAVADPYRWLEDPDSAETRRWVDAQNALTRAALDGPVRDRLAGRLRASFDRPRVTAPFRRGRRYFFNWNPGLANQAILMVQDERPGPSRVLLDPNTLSPDGTVALTATAVSDDGAMLVYALSASGSDRQEMCVRDVATGVDRPDRLRWVKFASIAWAADGSGFYYLRFPEPGAVPPEDEQYFGRIYFHRLGDAQRTDALVFDAPHERETVPLVDVSGGGRFVVVTAQRGASDRSEIHVIDRARGGDRLRPLFTGYDAAYAFAGSAGDRLFFRTDRGAPRGRVMAIEAGPDGPAGEPVTVIPESADTLSDALVAAGRLVASYRRDASDRIRLFDLSGAPAGEVTLPSLGSVSTLDGRADQDDLLLTFQSFTMPPAAFRCDVAAARLEPFAGVHGPATEVATSGAYVTDQVWYPSKDGTRVSMFLVHRADVRKDADRPVLLTGYGGFNISLTPAFDPAMLLLLDAGGILAVANLRGGGEYGEAWHDAGMRERKQNVFDDFIAGAEYLIAQSWTRPRRLAITGGSNGGLLTGAALVQRPDLFGAVICRVPVADMLRYHLFTVGRFWIPEYGSADDPEQFRYLVAYSPYHNVKEGAPYPATLVMTADTDDRVSPGMAKKFGARLQAATGGDAPILVRVETNAGHGAGKPTAKMIDEDADMFAFLFEHLGLDA